MQELLAEYLTISNYLSFIVKLGTIEKSISFSPQSVQVITSLLYSDRQLLHPHPSLGALSGEGRGADDRRLSSIIRKRLTNKYIPRGMKSSQNISITKFNM